MTDWPFHGSQLWSFKNLVNIKIDFWGHVGVKIKDPIRDQRDLTGKSALRDTKSEGGR